MSIEDVIQKGVDLIGRVTVSHVIADAQNAGREAVFEGVWGADPEDIGATYSAILDERVCPFCASLDGLTVDLRTEEGRALYDKYSPAQHENCRCFWIFTEVGETKFKPTENFEKTWEDRYREITAGKKHADLSTHQIIDRFARFNWQSRPELWGMKDLEKFQQIADKKRTDRIEKRLKKQYEKMLKKWEKDGIIEKGMDILIDEMTPCLIDRETGKIVDTQVKQIAIDEIKKIQKKYDWKFDWVKHTVEWDQVKSEIYKLTVKGSKEIQGLIHINIEKGTVEATLLESAPHNLGRNGKYKGVGPHLMAIAVKRSIQSKGDGYVFFDSKTLLKEHYMKEFGAKVLFGNRMYIDEKAAQKLIEKYFPGEFQ